MKKINPIFIGNSSLLENTATIDECYNYLKDKEVLAIDIETTRKYYKYENEGLDPYTSKIVMFQIGDKDKQYIIDTRVIDISKLLPILVDPSVEIIGQNLKFEYKHLLHNYGIKINNLYDTMLVEQIIYNGLNYNNSLEALNKRYLGIQVDKSTRLEFLDIKDKPFTLKQINYGAEDILFPLLIRDKQIPKVYKKQVQGVLNLEFQYISVLGDMEMNGMYFDKEVWKNTYNKNLIEFNKAQDELNQFVLDNYSDSKFINRQLSLFDTGVTCNIKWTSSKQVIEFFKYLEICPQEVSKTTKKLSYTVNAKVVKSSLLSDFKDINDELKDLVNRYLHFKEIEQSVTTFGIKFFKYINPITKRMHSNYSQIVRTGRSSSSNPNLQNIPAAKGFRSAFNCAPGWKIVNADYGGQETLCLAEKSREPNIIKLINDGGCMHSFVARHIFPELKDLTDKEIKSNHSDKRSTSKAAGFAIQFGGTGFTISKNLGISTEEGDFVYDSYFKAFPDLKDYFEKVKAETYRQGYILIDPITGRKQWFREPSNNKERGAIDRKSLNSPKRMGLITVM